MQTNKIREIIMPPTETLCKRLQERLEAAQQAGTRVDLFWLERTLWVLIAAWAGQVLGALIGMIYPPEDRGEAPLCLACGHGMNCQGRRRRPVLSSFGLFRYERVYYYCRSCGYGRAPRDETLGVWDREFSPRLQRVMGYLAGYLSFGSVQKVLAESYELEISDEAIRQVSEEIGQEARAWEDRQKEQAGDPAQKPVRRAGAPKVWVLEADGKKVPLRDGNWQEVKVMVLYELSDRVETAEGRHELIKRAILARHAHWEAFAGHVWAAMQRAGVCEGDRIIAIGDGGNNIEPIFEWVAPESQRIRDFYHVAQYIYAIGEVRFGAGTPDSQQWCRLQLHKLKASQVEAVIRSIRHLKLTTAAAEEVRETVLGYLNNHSYAMDYAQYEKEGLPRGSGAVEGGCRLIGARTNGCGRRWSPTGCDRIVALRVAVLNDHLDAIRPRPSIERLAA